MYYYVPGLLKHFTTSQINAMIAPRAHLGLAGLQDKLTPVEGLNIIERDLTRLTRAIPSVGSSCATTSGTRRRQKAARKCSLSSSAFSDGAQPPASLSRLQTLSGDQVGCQHWVDHSN